jgi:hypothetical protein
MFLLTSVAHPFLYIKVKEEYKKWGLAINFEKTKYVHMGEGKEILKYDGGEEIKLCTEYCK